MISLITLLILIIVCIILLILLLTGIFKVYPIPSSDIIDEYLDSISKQTGWSSSEGNAVTGERGTCSLYSTFSTDTIIVDALEPIAPLKDYPEEFQCSDGFTLALQKRQRTCVVEECIGYDGNLYSNGEIEYFYLECGNLKQCEDVRSAVILNSSICVDYVRETNITGLGTQGEPQGFSTVNCPSSVTESASPVFMNVEEIPSGYINLVRIRAPGTDQCLMYSSGSNQINSAPCLDNKDDGYVWIRPVSYTNADGMIFPSRLVVKPSNFSTINWTDEDSILNLLYSNALQETPDLVLSSFSGCSSLGNCPAFVDIVSVYSY